MSKQIISTINNEPFKLPNGWLWYYWGDLITSYQQGMIRSNLELGSGNVNYLKMGDVDSKGWHTTENLALTNASKDEIETYRLNNGDFLINVRNSMELVGKTCLIRGVNNRTLFNHMLVRIEHHDNISNEYISAIFTTPQMQKFVSKCKSGTTTVIALYKEDLLEIPIPVPPKEQMLDIANIIECLNKKIELNN